MNTVLAFEGYGPVELLVFVVILMLVVILFLKIIDRI